MTSVGLIERLDAAPLGAAEPAESGPGAQWWAWRASVGAAPQAWLHTLPRLGQSRPRYSFHLGRVVHAAPELGLRHVQATLQLGHDATGEAELSALQAAPGVPVAALQALLRAALAALAQQRAGEAAVAVVELPGWCDAQGRSPFWEGLVAPFVPGDLRPARQRLGESFGSHLGLLLPRQLIHVGFLPAATQAALGQVAASHQAWLPALSAVGFADWRQLRIEDGGPLWARPLSHP